MKSPEYKDFVALLSYHGVRYLVVGAHAVSLYSRPRATKDLDIWVDPRPDNSERVIATIREFFGGFDFGLSVEDLTSPGRIVQLGVAPARIDILTSISTLSFDEAWESRSEDDFEGVSAMFLSLNDLIAAKEAAGRPQDLADLASLRRAKQRKSP